MSQKPILITGATGTNGRELIAQLAAKGRPVRALVRDIAKAGDLAGPYVSLVQGDLSDQASLEKAMEGVEVGYVVTAVVQNAAALFHNFYAAAKRTGLRRIVKFSGMGAGLDAQSEIMRDHGRSDQALRESGLAYTILQPNSFHQNMLWQAEGIRHTGRFYLPLGDAAQSTIDVRDIAEATVKVLTEPGHENQEYVWTGPASLRFDEVAAVFSRLLEKPVTYVPISTEASEQAMQAAGMPAWNAHVVAELQGQFATGAYAHVSGDLEKLLGRPGRTFEQFARDYLNAFKA